jgi:gamma-glutamylcyclotransferase
MSTLKYFAYGSNLHPVRLQQRVPESEFLCVASLAGYRLCFHKRSDDGSAKADAWFTGSANDVIYGALYRMPESERLVLDRYEGVGNGYEVRQLEVVADDGLHDAFIYIAQASHLDTNLQPYHWYRDLVLHGADHHDLPEHYISSIAAVEAVEDAMVERNQSNQEILRKIARFTS